MEEMETLLLQEADPLAVTMDGQPIKQEVEWSDDELDMAENVESKPFSPSASPPMPSMPSPAEPPPGKDKKTLMFKLKLPSGKSIPATFITDPKVAFTSESFPCLFVFTAKETSQEQDKLKMLSKQLVAVKFILHHL